jgi:tetratricopeptide (TPR) repeat protein
MKTDGLGLAYQLFRRSGEIFPGEPIVWHNIGTVYHDKNDDDKAEEFYRRAIKCKPGFSESLTGLSMTALNKAQFGQCIEYANRALVETPDLMEARINRGMAYLALKRWREGWRDYNANLGKDKNRMEIIYGDEPRWDGSKGKNVVVYGEQGLGDEISFASCLPDLIRDSKSVTIECDSRLEGLFKRSFPTCDVYGTRYKKEVPEWRKKKFDARVALGQLPEFYRQNDSDFPGTPYLVPNPQMALQWRALLDSLGPKPKIGITWTGGLPHTGQRKRSVKIETYRLLFDAFDADWISLQYKDHDVKEAEERFGIKLHDWEWGTRFHDYDQTVALVSQLDLVISVCTAVVDVCAGLGKDCWTLVPAQPYWRHLHEGEWFPWGSSVSLHRQKGREWPIGVFLTKLREKFGNRPRTEEAA